ncbi:MAG: hypothetical protein UZ14_CFX002001771 [Chloroflexi bacterium OLB14]|nr:MAG: hypothetical protein UZ14_CFX002001771 [Chloroflexi bacterium OLB14]
MADFYPPENNQYPDEDDERDDGNEIVDNIDVPIEDQEIDESEMGENVTENSGTNVDLNNVSDSEVHIEIGNKIFLDLPGQGIRVIDLASSEINKNKSVYVESSRFADLITRVLNERLIIIVGDAHAGKYATAIHISQKLSLENSDLKIRSLRFSDDASLIDFVENEECPNNSVFVAQDGFSVPGLGIAEIQRHSHYLVSLLVNRNDYVIITADTGTLVDNEIPEQYKIELSPFSTPDLQKILKKHLSYYELSDTSKSIVEEKKQQIISALRTAHAVDRLFQIISRRPIITAQEIDDILSKISNTVLDAKVWFQSLGVNQRYYAMLVALCRELDRNQLWLVYEKIVAALRSKKVNIDAPLNFSEEELRSSTYTVLTEIESLEFQDIVYRDQVFLQIREAYLQQFKSILHVFSDLVLSNSSNQNNRSRDMRIAVAVAVGEIAKASWSEAFTDAFNIWANHPETTIKSAVAHAIRQTATAKIRQKDIAYILSRWKISSNINLRWTSAAVCERLYPIMPYEALNILNELSNDKSNFVRRAVAHAVVAIARRDLEESIQIILAWVNTERKRTKRTAGDVFVKLLENSKRLSLALENDSYRTRLMPLVTELIVQGDEHLTTGLSLLQEWIISSNENQELLSSIENSLLNICMDVPVDIRESVIDEIQEKWVQSEDESLYRFSVVLVDLIQKLPQSETPQIPTQYFIFDDDDNEDIEEDEDFEFHNTN